MDGLLSLKWNNHSSSFINKFSSLRKKGLYCDATVICDGMYFTVHKLILSTCSNYFSEIFEKIDCKNPYIIIKDIDPMDMEILLNYMYKGEVNVLQERLPNLIKAAEALKVKGLAVPDDEPPYNKSEVKRNSSEDSLCHSKSSGADKNTPVSSLVKTLAKEQNATDSSNAGAVNEDNESNSSTSPFLDSLLNNEKIVKQEPEDESLGCSSEVLNREQMELGNNSTEIADSDQSNQSSFDDQVSHAQAFSWLDKMEVSTTGSRNIDMITGERPYVDSAMSYSSDVTCIPQTLNLRMWSCSHCSYQTPRPDHLQRHMNFKHLLIRPFPCQLCSKSFCQKSDLLRHIKVHDKYKFTNDNILL